MVGRPRSFDREDGVSVALDEFWRHGFDATSIAELTRAMGIAPPSLYAAYGDKRRLFDEAAAHYVERFRRGIDDSLAAPTAREGVATLLRLTAEVQTAPGRPPGCLVLSEPLLLAERERMRATIAARIARGAADGDLPADTDPDSLAGFVEAVMAGMSARARDGAGRTQLTQTAELAIAALPAVDELEAPASDRRAPPGA